MDERNVISNKKHDLVYNPDCRKCLALKARCSVCAHLYEHLCHQCQNPRTCLTKDKRKARLIRERFINLPCYLGVHKKTSDLKRLPGAIGSKYLIWEQATSCNAYECCKLFLSFRDAEGCVSNHQMALCANIPEGFGAVTDDSLSLLYRNETMKHLIRVSADRTRTRNTAVFLAAKTDDEVVNTVNVQKAVQYLLSMPGLGGSFNRLKMNPCEMSLYRQCLWYVRNLYYFQPEILTNGKLIPFTIRKDIENLSKNNKIYETSGNGVCLKE